MYKMYTGSLIENYKEYDFALYSLCEYAMFDDKSLLDAYVDLNFGYIIESSFDADKNIKRMRLMENSSEMDKINKIMAEQRKEYEELVKSNEESLERIQQMEKEAEEAANKPVGHVDKPFVEKIKRMISSFKNLFDKFNIKKSESQKSGDSKSMGFFTKIMNVIKSYIQKLTDKLKSIVG